MSANPINGKDGHVRCPRCHDDMSPAVLARVGFPLPELHWRCQNAACGALSAPVPLPRGLVGRMLHRPGK